MSLLSLFSFLLYATLLVTNFANALTLPDALSYWNVEAVFPDDEDYAVASAPFNMRFDYKPAVITYPVSPQEISEIVKFGYTYNMTVVARSGGHSYIAAGLGGKDGAIVVDLSKNKNITIQSGSQDAVIQYGNRLGDVALALNEQGRAMPHGSCPYVGIGGHAAFGGFGFASRMWGLTLDTIQSATLILPNGTITTVSDTLYPDLFWAVRGSAPSYGIVYEAQHKTFEAPSQNTVYQVGWEANVEQASSIISSFQDFVQSGIPSTFGGELNVNRASAEGHVAISVFFGYWGQESDFNATVEPFLSKLPSDLPASEPRWTIGSWADALGHISGDLHTVQPDGNDTFYAKSLLTPSSSPLTYDAIHAYVDYLAYDGFHSDLAWFTQIELYGGSYSEISAVPVDNTAFFPRDALFNFQLYASSNDHQPPYPDSGYTFVEDLVNSILSNEPEDWPYSSYTNYIEDRLEDWQQRYYGSHYSRLQSLKREIDPKNVYSFPTSIEL